MERIILQSHVVVLGFLRSWVVYALVGCLLHPGEKVAAPRATSVEFLGPHPHILTPTKPLGKGRSAFPLLLAHVPPVLPLLLWDHNLGWSLNPMLGHQLGEGTMGGFPMDAASSPGVQAQLLAPVNELPVVVVPGDGVLAKVLLPEVYLFVEEGLEDLPHRSAEVFGVHGDLIQQALRVTMQSVASEDPVVHRLEADDSVGHRVATETSDGVQEPVSKTICPGVEGAGHFLPLPVVGQLGVLPDRLLGEAWFQYLHSSESLVHYGDYIMSGV